MASSVVEDEDLIDLDDGGVVGCVSRVTNTPEASPEELEHLLDVCPPKLEQKLSLTRRQETIRENSSNDDILVTLGHDQVVPRRKRIDVVSSETIKRIRDITKNLEPVMRNIQFSEQLTTSNGGDGGHFVDGGDGGHFVDGGDGGHFVDSVDGTIDKNVQHDNTNNRRRDVTFETQAINSAFDFLSELEDDDDDNDDDDHQPPDKKRRKNDNLDKDCDPKPPSFYPLEPTCLIEDKTTRYRDIDRANRAIEANDRTSVIELDNDSANDDNHENLAFEISPLSKISRQDGKTTNFNETRFGRTRNDDTNSRRVERKSWSEGETRGLVRDDDDKNCKQRDGVERSTSIEIDCLSEPSTSNGITRLLRRSARNIVRRVPENSASSSECSEVDWSWVEEYDSPTIFSSQYRVSPSSSLSSTSSFVTKKDKASKTMKTPNAGPLISRSSLRRSNGGRPSSAPTKLVTSGSIASSLIEDEKLADSGATALMARGGGSTKRCAGWQLSESRDSSNGSVAMSVVGTGGKSTGSLETRADLTANANDYLTDEIATLRASDQSSNDFDRTNQTNIANDDSHNDDLNVLNDFNVHDDGRLRSSGRNSNNRSNGTNSWLRASMRRLRHLRMPDNDRRNVNDTTSVLGQGSMQNGPNSLPDIALIAPDVLAAHTNATNSNNSGRPSSAPVVTRDNNSNSNLNTPRRGRRHANRQRGASRAHERHGRNATRQINAAGENGENNEISVQTGGTTTTSPQGRRIPSATGQNSNATTNNGATRRICERQRDVDRDNERGDDDDEDENPLGRWPHPLSPALACLGCTLGLFNISRFAILSIQFGANFIVQFLVLSLVLGIPLLTLQVCLGQRLAAGAVDMWRISPIFHGVGIALLVAQAFIGIYSIIGVSWMFVYFRDSFITKQDRYRWAEPFLLYRDDTRMLHNTTTYKLHETVPDYFSGVVLQRNHLNEPDPGVVTLKFQVAFNLAVVWMIVFVSLSKGLRSYGKVVYVFTLVPVFGTLILCTKLLGLTPPGSIHQLFPATVWSEFFINTKSWVAASSEVFLTWGLLGAAAMQVAAHNKHKHLLQRDTSLVVVLTFVVLLLSAFLANTCVQILRHYGYTYTTSSFEKISGYTFMRHVNQPPPSGYSNTPERFMSHASFLLGQRVVRPGADLGTESGYQALRLSTELVPATLAILGTEQVSPFWAVLFYFILILFGIAQQLAIWHCVITGIMAINTKMMKLWETTITFFSCACAYILGLPMATELGIYVVYYLDYTVGGAWWIMILYLVQVGAVFAVRGRPHTGETVVAELFPPTGRCMRHWAGPLLSFTWNVILPVALMVLSITTFKSSSFRELYVYRRTSRDYWSVWARQLGAAIQLTPILVIPGVAIIQTCRYLNSGPPDIFDRIQLLYRPPLDTDDSTGSPTNYGNDTSTSIHGNGILPSTNDVPFEDPPPKYTPPPSYTTATGARIAKMLRQSFRRSVRRLANVLGESSAPRARPALQPPPPDYATVLVEMNQSVLSRNSEIHDLQPDVTDTRNSLDPRRDIERNRASTIDRMTRISTIDRSSVERTHSTMDRGRGRMYNNIGSSNLTAADVANLLRSSIRRGATRTQQSLCRNSSNESPESTFTITSDSTDTTNAASVENLVNAAVPINEDSIIYEKDSHLVHDEGELDADDDDENDDDDDDDDDDKKTVNETDNPVSVI